ncbi:MAG: hypothetical protein QXI39_03625 [Candidatus Bathyarchaeia archaeon]
MKPMEIFSITNVFLFKNVKKIKIKINNRSTYLFMIKEGDGDG